MPFMTDGQQGPRVGTLLADRFQVLEVIGKGGMGIVVRAFDQLTSSEVAVKHVRPDLAEDPDYAERLLREAQLARDVSHPNICRVHDVYRHGDEVLLSMEYVHGETLRKRLDRGPIPPAEALDISRQICAGVAAAHQKGVIHRDLKPENVLLESSGRAVVLDFGVARKEGTPRDTVTGIALGTPRYMSPEQQQGKAVGPATDVFALGLVIEELWGNRKQPGWLRTLLRKATERDPRRRFPDAEALGTQLAHPIMRLSLAPILLLSGAAAVATLLFVVHPLVLLDLLHLAGSERGQRDEVRKTLLTRQWSGAQLATLSPDGKLLGYLEETGGIMAIFLRPMRDTGAPIRQILAPDGRSVAWISFSPDSRRITFSTGRRLIDRDAEVYVLSLTDGPGPGPAPRRLIDGSTPSWFPDGKTLAISHCNQDTGRCHLSRIAAEGGEATAIEADPPASLEYCPAVSPDGKQVAYLAGLAPGGLRVVPVAGGKALTLDPDPSFYYRVQWTPDGKRIVYGSDTRGLLSIDADSPGGHPATLLPPIDYAISPSLSADGKILVYTRNVEAYELSIIDRNGHNRQEVPINYPVAAIGYPLFSPDGKHIALQMSIRDGTQRLVALVDRTTGTVRPLVEPGEAWLYPESFIDNGNALIVGTRKPGGLRVVPVLGRPVPKIEFGADETRADISPDGKLLSTLRAGGKEGAINSGLWVRPVGAPPTQAECWVVDGAGQPAWSPDSTQVAMPTNSSAVVLSQGPDRVRTLQLQDPITHEPLLTKQIRFAKDGKLLLIHFPRIYEIDLSTEAARLIISPDHLSNLFGLTLSPDDLLVAYVMQPFHTDLWLVESTDNLLRRR